MTVVPLVIFKQAGTALTAPERTNPQNKSSRQPDSQRTSVHCLEAIGGGVLAKATQKGDRRIERIISGRRDRAAALPAFPPPKPEIIEQRISYRGRDQR